MRTITKPVTTGANLKELPAEKVAELGKWCTDEIEDALVARHAIEQRWLNALKQYNCIPKNPNRNIPIENAPNIEIMLGAIGTDSIYAQVVDLIWNISPLITVRAVNGKWTDAQKAMQRWVEYVAVNELDLRQQSDHAILDDVLMGTGAFYIPWVEEIKKTNVLETVWQGPRVFAMPPEDVIVPGGITGTTQTSRWIALRFWYTKAELELAKKKQKWKADDAQITGGLSNIRSEREKLSGTASSKERQGDLYEIIVMNALYDIDDDGINEDLEVVFDRTSHAVLAVNFAKYDHRPIEKMCYQIRAHQFYGMGVMEMLSMLEDAASDVFSYWIANMLLANCRAWAAPPGQLDTPLRLFPNKVLELADPEKLKDLKMADVYNSGPQAVAMIMSLAERRTGTNDMSMPRPSQVLGSRTPATTSMMLFQQVNRRFTPAFDQVRLCVSGVVIQAMYRYQEQLLANNNYARTHIMEVMGAEDGIKVIEVLKDKDFGESVAIELTASSSTINREVERQNAMFLVGLLAQYYEKVLQLVTIVANPQTPEAVANVAKKIAIAAGEAIERTVRTFDQIRDPSSFIVEFEAEVDQAASGAQDANALQGLMAMLGQMGGGQIETPVT